MIAQALAVLHPATQVSRLVLAGTQAGNGKAQPVRSAAAAALSSGNAEAVLSVLFPKDQAAASTYGQSITAYPGYYEAPKSAEVGQSAAIAQWQAGKDPDGPKVSGLTVPAFVADDSEDALVPKANDRQLAALIPGATLHLYPDAGHAFLFQDQTEFAPQVASFTE